MRGITIRARIILLICISVIFSVLIGGAFLSQLFQLKSLAIDETQQAMLEGQKEKLKVAVHSLALSLGESVKAAPDKEAWAGAIRAQINPIRFEADESGYYFVYQGTTVVSVPIKPELTGKNLAEVKDKNGVAYVSELAEAAKKGGGFVNYVFDKPGKALVPKLAYAEPIPGTDYWIGTGVYIDNIDERKEAISAQIGGMVRTASLTIGGVVAALFLLVVLPLSVMIFKSIIAPLSAATQAAETVAGGDLSVRLNQAGRDEITHLETALNTMVGTLRTNMEAIGAKTREAEEKARAAQVATDEANEAKAEAIRARSEGLLAAANKLETVVERVSSASEEISGQAQHIDAATVTQKERITETATAMEEMNATVLEVARNATQAAQGAETARSQATAGNQVVTRSIKSMDDLLVLARGLKENMDLLGRRATEISQVMNVINDIADQTNLLALNAAIEAARAGDAGRGFAVVADEVRKLAEKTMTATKEVGETIRGIQEVSKQNIEGMDAAGKAIEESTDLVRQSGKVLEEIVNMSESTAQQVSSIATAAEEQSAASEEINQSVDQINAIATETSNSMQETTIAIREMANQADTLRALVAELKREGGA
ncbi:MAG: methyl-accepting chemotaxis protein [Desulfovibrio sp.]